MTSDPNLPTPESPDSLSIPPADQAESLAVDSRPEFPAPQAVVPAEIVPPVQPDPAWNGWDVVRLAILLLVAIFACIASAVLITKRWIYPEDSLTQVALMPLVNIAGQSVAYLIVLAYMYVLVTRERHRPDFLNAIHWIWPPLPVIYVLVGFVLSVLLQLLANLLPVPKNLPIDRFFQTPTEAWVVTICGITLFPLMEELFFRGFLYPVLKRRVGIVAAVLLTAMAFAGLHGAQLSFAWGPVLIIFIVGLMLTVIRAERDSVAASLLTHIGYNGFISVATFVSSDGFRHLEKLK